MGKKIVKIPYLIFTLCMCLLATYGVYGFITAPAKAKQAQEEIEEMLRRNQEEAQRLQEEAAERQRIEDEKRRQEMLENAENAYAQEDGYNPATLYRQFDDASQMRVVGIGDSVMLAALNQMYAQFPNGYFDAVFGRTIYEGMGTLYQLEEQNALGDVIVFSLGTNSYINEEDVEELIAHSGGRPTFFMSTFGVSNDSTAVMQRVIDRHENAFMVDWGNYAAPHTGEWILADGLHPNDLGSQAYAQFICDEITKDVLQGPMVKIEEDSTDGEE